jgi:hypothetical protein
MSILKLTLKQMDDMTKLKQLNLTPFSTFRNTIIEKKLL